MISAVIPVYNEEESLPHCYEEVTKELKAIDKNYEIIFIDDGSTDTSLELLKAFSKKDENVKVFSFRKNHGKAEALTLGFQKALGEYIVTLDADLQDKPSEIKKLLDKSKNENIDIVSGWRKDRKDKSKMVVISRIFNFITSRVFDLYLHDYNCGLKVYKKDAAKHLRLYGGLHRFIPLLASQQGFTVDELPTAHQPRQYGKSKYGFSKVWKDLPDIFTMIFLGKYSKRPLHFFGVIGGLLLLLGFVTFAYLGILWLFGESIGRRPLLIFSVLLMLGGLQIFFTGFIAELVINTTNKEYSHPSLRFSTKNT